MRERETKMPRRTRSGRRGTQSGTPSNSERAAFWFPAVADKKAEGVARQPLSRSPDHRGGARPKGAGWSEKGTGGPLERLRAGRGTPPELPRHWGSAR